jgi:hypothetical protein
VTAAHEFGKVERILSCFVDIGGFVGVCALTDKNTRSRKFAKEPQECNDFLDHGYIFKLLRKREYENMMIARFGELSKTQPVFLHKACLEQFREIPVLEAQNLVFKELKKRNKMGKSIFERVPDELKTVVYFSDLSLDVMKLNRMLETAYRGRLNVLPIFEGTAL